MRDVLEIASLHDHGILLEYQLPLSSRRIDCMVCGRDANEADNAVIVELKQWERCEPAEADKLVNSWVGGSRRDVLHPSVQVGQYRQYLEDTHVAFHEEDHAVQLSACSYLHNYLAKRSDPLLAPKFAEVLRANPLFDTPQSKVSSGRFGNEPRQALPRAWPLGFAGHGRSRAVMARWSTM